VVKQIAKLKEISAIKEKDNEKKINDYEEKIIYL